MLEEETNKENWLPCIDRLVEFEKQPVEVQDFMGIAAHCRGLYLSSITNNQKMSSCRKSSSDT